MLVALTFEAKPGKEKELEALLDDPEAARHVAQRMGATRNTLFFGHGRMVRILEFPEGAQPVPLAKIAQEDAAIAAFLRRLGSLVKDGFDMDDAQSFAAFNERVRLPLVLDVRP